VEGETCDGHAIIWLRAIPASMIGWPGDPHRDETIVTIQRGIAECAEHLRLSATTSLAGAAWSPAVSTQSFSETAACATVISHHAEILQPSLVARARQLGATQLSDDLIASCSAAGRARLAWLTAARAWRHFTIDATGGIAPAAQQAAGLALRTGRLAYADPDWTLASGPGHDRRPPDQLAPSPDSFATTLTVVHQACATLTSLAAAGYTRITKAARAGRILVPATQVPVIASSPYQRAPVSDCENLLAVYRDAGVASARATGKVSELPARHEAYRSQRSPARCPLESSPPPEIPRSHPDRSSASSSTLVSPAPNSCTGGNRPRPGSQPAPHRRC
jgi:hypothetical protein